MTFHAENQKDHSAVDLSTCVQFSSLSRSNSVDRNHVKKTCDEQLTSVEVEVSVPDREPGSRRGEILMTPEDQHHLRSRYYNETLVVVLWLLSVACCMSSCVIVVVVRILLLSYSLYGSSYIRRFTHNSNSPLMFYNLCDCVLTIVSLYEFLDGLTA